MTESAAGDDEVLRQAAAGDDLAINALLEKYRSRLKRMVACRLDERLAKRIDPSDVVQEAMIVASVGLSEYCQQPPMPFYNWLRRITGQRLFDLQRRHLAAERRSVLREQHLYNLPDSTIQQMAVRCRKESKFGCRTFRNATTRKECTGTPGRTTT